MNHSIYKTIQLLFIYFLIKIFYNYFHGKNYVCTYIEFYKQWQDFRWSLLLLLICIFSTRIMCILSKIKNNFLQSYLLKRKLGEFWYCLYFITHLGIILRKCNIIDWHILWRLSLSYSLGDVNWFYSSLKRRPKIQCYKPPNAFYWTTRLMSVSPSSSQVQSISLAHTHRRQLLPSSPRFSPGGLLFLISFVITTSPRGGESI